MLFGANSQYLKTAMHKILLDNTEVFRVVKFDSETELVSILIALAE